MMYGQSVTYVEEPFSPSEGSLKVSVLSFPTIVHRACRLQDPGVTLDTISKTFTTFPPLPGTVDGARRLAQDSQDTLLKNKEQLLLLQEENLRLTRENSIFADTVEQHMQVGSKEALWAEDGTR
jgi:hypothetical protein